MGLEAFCPCRVNDVTADAKARLEAHDLIVGAPFRRVFRKADLGQVEVSDGCLSFRSGGADIALHLGAARASTWARKIASAPPSLAQKLGVTEGSPVFVIGQVDVPVLLAALANQVTDPGAAKLSLAVVSTPAELDAALLVHGALPDGSPIWVVHAKGPKAAFDETAVRAHMRGRGYRDTKVSAVCDALTAARYARGAP